MAFLWVVLLLLLLLLLAEGSCQLMIESCHDLKTTIEGVASASSAFTLQLQSKNGLYRCMESIHVGAAQSVVITGGGDGLSNVFVSLLGCSPTARPSLFVNEGSLRLSNISVERHNARDDVVEGAGESDDHRSRRQEKDEQQPACAGVGLIWDSGRAVVEDSHVFESGLAVSRRRSGDEGALHGRVIYSGAASSSSSSSSSKSSSISVVVSRSSFELGSCDDVGDGAAFFAEGGDLTIEGSRLDVGNTPPFDTAARGVMPSPGTGPEKPRILPGGGDETATTSGRAGAAVVVVVDGNLVARDTVFARGFAHGEEGRVLLIVFEESSDSREGEHSFVMDGCSFHPSRGSSSSNSSNGNDGGKMSNLRRSRRRRRHRRRRLRSTAEVLGMHLDEGLLLIIVTAGLLLILAGMCVLDTWLRRHPDGIDRFLPRRYRISEGRRVGHHHAADTSGVDLSELEAAGFAGVTKRAAIADAGSGSHGGALATTSSRLLSDRYSVNERSYDQETSFVVPQRYKDVLAKKPAANSRSSSLRKGGGASFSKDTATFTTATESTRSSSFATLDLNRLTLVGFANSDSETVYSANSPAAWSSARRKQQFGRDKSGTPPPLSAQTPPPQMQMQTPPPAACLTPDSFDGADSAAAPPSCLSMSTADGIYESGSCVLMTSPLPEGVLMAFASANSQSSVAFETSPIAQAARGAGCRSLPAAVGDDIEEVEEEEEMNVEEREEEREEKVEARENAKREEDGEEEEEEEAIEGERGPVMWTSAASQKVSWQLSAPLGNREDGPALGLGDRNIGVLAAMAAGSFDSSSSLSLSLPPPQSSPRRHQQPLFPGEEEEGENVVAKTGGDGGGERETAVEEPERDCLSSSGSDSSPSAPAHGDAVRPEDSSLSRENPSPEESGEDEGLSLDLGDAGPAPGIDSYATGRVNLASISPATDTHSTMSCFSPVVPLNMALKQEQQQQQAVVSPAGSSFTPLSSGALSKMLQMLHGGDTIPEVLPAARQFTPDPAAVSATAANANAYLLPEPDDGDMCYSPDTDDPSGGGGGGDGESNSRVFSSSPPPLSGKVSSGRLPAEEAAEAESSCPRLAPPAGVAGGEAAATEPSAPAVAALDMNARATLGGGEKPAAAVALGNDMCRSPTSTGARAGDSGDDRRPFSLDPAVSPPGSNNNKTNTSKAYSTGDPFPQLVGYSPDCSRILLELNLAPSSPEGEQESGRHGTGDGGSGSGSGSGAGSMTGGFSTVSTTLTLSDVNGAAAQPLYCSPPSTSGGTPGVTPGGTPRVSPSGTPTGVMVAASYLSEEGRNASGRPVPQG